MNIILPVKRVKLLYAERDTTAASGDVAYTGVGFKPSQIKVSVIADTVFSFLPGYYDNTPRYVCIYTDRTNWFVVNDRLIEQYQSAGAHQSAIVKSLDADGFTLTWTKTGAPTGIAYLIFEVYE